MENKKHQFKPLNAGFSNFIVHNTGFQECQPLHTWDGIRDHFLVHLISKGCGEYNVNGITYKLSAGDMFLVYPDTHISYIADINTPWEYYWLGFSGDDATDILEKTAFTKDSPILYEKCLPLKKYMLDIFSNRGSDYSSQLIMAANSFTFFAKLIELNDKKEKITREDYTEKAVEFIKLNYSSNITVSDIAKALNISRSHLYRLFYNVYAISPSDFLTNYKIEKATSLLENTNLSIAQVATSSGFENQFYFSSVFKKVMGKSPKDYRLLK